MLASAWALGWDGTGQFAGIAGWLGWLGPGCGG